MPRKESTAELRERLRLLTAITRMEERRAKALERQATASRLLARPGRSTKSKPTPKPSRRSAAPGKPPRKLAERRPRKVRRPSESRAFEAQHPRGPGGRFLPRTKAQAESPVLLRRWALFLRPAYGKKAYPNEVIVLILDENPAKMTPAARGAWVRAIRQARHKEDARVRWLQEQGSGEWLDPTVEPGTWWVERRENLD